MMNIKEKMRKAQKQEMNLNPNDDAISDSPDDYENQNN
jgi:hypothetical protein